MLLFLIDSIAPLQVSDQCNNAKNCKYNNSISNTFTNVKIDKDRFLHDITFYNFIKLFKSPGKSWIFWIVCAYEVELKKSFQKKSPGF